MQAAAVAGEIDGFQSDLVSALKVNAAGGDVVVTRHVGITNIPFFSIVASRDSDIMGLADLAGQSISLSLNTITQYVTDTLLAGAGVEAGAVAYRDAPGILQRQQDISDGDSAAALLPEPFATLTGLAGNRVLATDASLDYVPEALSISSAALADKGDAVAAFLAAYESAVDTLNAMGGDNNAYRDFLAAHEAGQGREINFAIVNDLITVPMLAQASVPSAEQFQSVHDWALEKGLISEAQAYGDVVDGSMLPEVTVVMMDDADEMAEEAEEEAAAADAEEMAEADLDVVFINGYLSTLPILVAQGAGYFAEEGVTVALHEIVNLANLRDGLLDGTYDGYLVNGLMDVFFPHAYGDGEGARVVREVELANTPSFIILAGPTSGVETLADLAGKNIGVVQGSAGEYLFEGILASVGLSGDDVEFLDQSDTETGRMFDLIISGELAATVTDPMMVAFASAYGGTVISDSTQVGYDGVKGVLGFRAETLAMQGDHVRAFLRAFERAVDTLNAMDGDNNAYRAFSEEAGMAGQTFVEIAVDGGFLPVPTFAAAAVPSAEAVASVQEWAVANGVLAAAIAYEDIVDGSFLPEAMAEE